LNLEDVAEGEGEVELEAFYEFVLASDAEDGGEEVFESGDFPFAGGMCGGVIFIGGAA
jgi:hypothetical protein